MVIFNEVFWLCVWLDFCCTLMVMVGVCGVECGGIIFKWRIIIIIFSNFEELWRWWAW
jgi:hypothetical protein